MRDTCGIYFADVKVELNHLKIDQLLPSANPWFARFFFELIMAGSLWTLNDVETKAPGAFYQAITPSNRYDTTPASKRVLAK